MRRSYRLSASSRSLLKLWREIVVAVTSIFILSLNCTSKSHGVDAEIINADDCAALFTLKAFAALAAPDSCIPLLNCTTNYKNVVCDESTGRVTQLHLSGQMLDGELPAAWGNLEELTVLMLANNSFAGTLPKEWGKLKNLRELNLQGNNLTGTPPASRAGMLQLEHPGLDYLGAGSSETPVAVLKLTLRTTPTGQTRKLLQGPDYIYGPPPSPQALSPEPIFLRPDSPRKSPSDNGKKSAPIAVIVGAVAGGALLIAVVIGGCIVWRRWGSKLRPPQLASVSLQEVTTDIPPPGLQEGGWLEPEEVDIVEESPSTESTYSKVAASAAGAGGTVMVSDAAAESDTNKAAVIQENQEHKVEASAAEQQGVLTAAARSELSSLTSRTNTARKFISIKAAELPLGAAGLAMASALAPCTHGPQLVGARAMAPMPPIAMMDADGPLGPVGNSAAGTAALAGSLGVAIVLPKCLELANKIIQAGDRVVANNRRCSQLIGRIRSMQPLLSTLQSDSREASPYMDASYLEDVLKRIEHIFQDVHTCVSGWCSASNKGALMTILHNMAASAWFQEGFLELEILLTGAFTDLNTAMNIQDRSLRLNIDHKKLEAEANKQTEEDLQGLVQELVAGDENGHDEWSTLEPKQKEVVEQIFSHHNLNLTNTVRKVRAEALDKRVKNLLIAPDEVKKGRLVGAGGFGEVHEGTWQGSIRVALKSLTVGVMSERDKADILREAYIHNKAQNHPNVCQLYGLVLQEPRDCIMVMEYYPQNLHNLLRDDTVVLSEKRRYAIAHGVALGMEHLHSKSIVHGDLKPSNLLVAADERVVVSDFGLSSISCVSLTSATMTATHSFSSHSTGLSLWYSPPELLDNRTLEKTEAGDVYAFGMVLLEIFTGRLPFALTQYEAVLRVVLSGGRPNIPEWVPTGCAELIRRCWHQDPAARPTFAEITTELRKMMP